jgi:hypothetical protein
LRSTLTNRHFGRMSRTLRNSPLGQTWAGPVLRNVLRFVRVTPASLILGGTVAVSLISTVFGFGSRSGERVKKSSENH